MAEEIDNKDKDVAEMENGTEGIILYDMKKSFIEKFFHLNEYSLRLA